MGVNMVGFCIEDEECVKKACEQEVIRRYFETKVNVLYGKSTESVIDKQKLIMGQLGVHVCDRPIVDVAITKSEKEKYPLTEAGLNS